MGDEKRDVLDRLSGWGFGGLKEAVRQGRAAADKGVWGLSINAAKGEDANRISAAYSALWANAPMLLEIVEELAQEVRGHRAKNHQTAMERGTADLSMKLLEAQKRAAKWETEFQTWKALAQAWKRECEQEREATARLSERLDAIKKAVSDE